MRNCSRAAASLALHLRLAVRLDRLLHLALDALLLVHRLLLAQLLPPLLGLIFFSLAPTLSSTCGRARARTRQTSARAPPRAPAAAAATASASSAAARRRRRRPRCCASPRSLGQAPAVGIARPHGVVDRLQRRAHLRRARRRRGRAGWPASASARLSSCRAVRSSCADVPYDTCEPDGARRRGLAPAARAQLLEQRRRAAPRRADQLLVGAGSAFVAALGRLSPLRGGAASRLPSPCCPTARGASRGASAP